MTNQPPSNLQDLADQINELVEQLTTSRGNALGDAHSLQLAGQTLMAREEKRLARKLGEDHPRVQQLRQRRETLLASIQRLEVEQQIAEISPPEVDDSQALVQGRVTDERSQGISGLQVALVDDNGKPLLREPTLTDRSGYYALKFDAAEVKGGRAARLVVNTASGREVYQSDALQISEGSRITLDVQMNRLNQSQPGGGTPPGDQKKPWVISGSVTDAQGNPQASLTVQVTSGEIKLKDPLGVTSTNRKGLYQIQIRQDPAIEGLQPGIKLTVSLLNQEGQQVFTSSEELLFKPGEQITYDIKLNSPDKKIKDR